jgi:hypothetical protein
VSASDAPTDGPPGNLQGIKADLEIGLSDIAAARTRPFDTEHIVEQGKRLLSEREGDRRRRVGLATQLPEEWIKAIKACEP